MLYTNISSLMALHRQTQEDRMREAAQHRLLQMTLAPRANRLRQVVQRLSKQVGSGMQHLRLSLQS